MSNQISERIKQKIMYVGSIIDSHQHTYCATISSVLLGAFKDDYELTILSVDEGGK